MARYALRLTNKTGDASFVHSCIILAGDPPVQTPKQSAKKVRQSAAAAMMETGEVPVSDKT